MGVPVLVLGKSGSGKSASLRNFKKDDIGVLNVASKPLPFKTDIVVKNKAGYASIKTAITSGSRKSWVIDDSQYLMAFFMFSRANEKGYDKFTQCAMDFYNLIKTVIDDTPDDCIVYFLHHVDLDEFGNIKPKTQGKMLDNQLCLEGLFSIVLMCMVQDGNHKFITQSDGTNPCKSPIEMFPYEMDNDLKAVDEAIREYYGMNKKEGKK